MILADEDGLGVDEIEDGFREILIRPDFLREVLGLYGLVVVNVDWELAVSIDPLLRHALQFAGDRIFGDFDTRHGH